MRSLRITAAALTFAASAGAVVVPAAFAQAGRPVIYGAGLRPAHFYPDNRTVASRMSWHTWNSSEAVGFGRTKTYAPGNADCSTVDQKIIYSRPRYMCGKLTYTRFRYQRWPAHGELQQTGSICIWYDE